jgi:hypothetical protein
LTACIARFALFLISPHLAMQQFRGNGNHESLSRQSIRGTAIGKSSLLNTDLSNLDPRFLSLDIGMQFSLKKKLNSFRLNIATVQVPNNQQ